MKTTKLTRLQQTLKDYIDVNCNPHYRFGKEYLCELRCTDGTYLLNFSLATNKACMEWLIKMKEEVANRYALAERYIHNCKQHPSHDDYSLILYALWFPSCSEESVVRILIDLKQRELVRLGRFMRVRVGLQNTKLYLIQQILVHLYKDKASEVYAKSLPALFNRECA